ncbi:helix-turn-helix transcriptional regulator [Parapedobacter sp. 10938]|uniref:helix-turn-helix transcriptional regulator n=1 Tax=Parapedobacter flavus TaxID=3110225 RepID=UPI002DBD079E|nr:helix-turn-helix transcriptional regulator [Parapedobacter sp. 10938]MEC3881608.1 helix-turn-helix transcriptional regulator [Parapedobacter sp. 10938]
MVSAIQIADENVRVHDTQAVADALSACRHQLPGASTGVWRQAHWQVSEQAYDLPDVYVSYIEIGAYAAETTIPIKCPRYDLYWLYLLRGALTITTPDAKKTLVETTENQYRVSYLPAGRYACSFRKGTHRIFYVVHKPKALFREESPELLVQSDVIAALQAQLATHVTTSALSMRDGAAESIQRFLRAPGTTFLKRKQALQHLSLDLIFHAHESLGQQAGNRAAGAEWVGDMEQCIKRCIRTGKPVDADTVAKALNLSAVYARRLFKVHRGETLGTYITEQKLQLAVQLLEEGDSPAMVARYVGWTHAHFSRTYKARFGVSPSTYNK